MQRTIYFQGGLGNQMFQWAFYRFLQSQGEQNLRICITSPSLKRHHDFDLFRIFSNIQQSNPKISSSYFQNQYYNLIFLARNRMSFSCWSLLFENMKNPIDKEYLQLGKQSLLMGFWQDKHYTEIAEQTLRNDFIFPPFEDDENMDISKKIKQSENSVSIHIRRGDYFQKNLRETYGSVCSLGYYNKAITKIKNLVSNPFFFVFSDDPEWVKQNLTLENTYYIAQNKGKNAFRDMQLISLCKHHIIANSSFSWWGAWLNSNPEKMIVAPDKWYNRPNDQTLSKLADKNWILIH